MTTTLPESTNNISNKYEHNDTRTQIIFLILVKGVLNISVDLLSTVLSVTTVVAVSRYKNLQITSNALIVCFSIGNSVTALGGGVLTILNIFYWDTSSKEWTIACTVQTYMQLLQHITNVFSLAAISVERVYSIYFPFHARKNNNFHRMVKIASILLVFCIMVTTIFISFGFIFGNFATRSYCLISIVTGKFMMTFVLLPVFLLGSLITLVNTIFILIKLIKLKRNAKSRSTGSLHLNHDYKITKMLLTGKFSQPTLHEEHSLLTGRWIVYNYFLWAISLTGLSDYSIQRTTKKFSYMAIVHDRVVSKSLDCFCFSDVLRLNFLPSLNLSDWVIVLCLKKPYGLLSYL